MIRTVLTLLILLAPRLAVAAETAGSEGLLIPALKMLGALALVVGLLLLFYAASRKGFGILPRSRDGQIKMVETKALGGKKFLCLVQVRGQEMLLGVSNERIECLAQLEPGSGNFAATLHEVERTEATSVTEVAS